MTRPLTSPERTRLQSAHFWVWTKAEVQNADGTYINATSHFRSAGWGEDLDNPVSGGTAVFLADIGVTSLAPFVETSALNVDDAAAYAPLLEPGRRIRLSQAFTNPGTAAVDADYRPVFLGKLDATDPIATPGRVTCDIRDLGAYLMDAQLEEKRKYGSDDGIDVETVMQQIIDDTLGAGVVTLVVPVSPDWQIREYEQERTNVMDAIRALALQIGWDVRYRWQADDSFALTLYEPDREKVAPDFTMGPDEYLQMTRLRTSDTDIRNAIRVNYTDGETGTPGTVMYEVEESIEKYGRRYGEITEAASSNIDSEVEATAMARGAALDLCFPIAEQEIRTLPFPFVELGDLVAYPANAKVYTDDQQFATVGIRHEIELRDGRTTITSRGGVAGAYAQWLRRLRRGGPPSGAPPAPTIDFVLAEGSSYGSSNFDGALWVGGRFNAGTVALRIYAELGDGPNTPIPDRTATTEAYPEFQRPQGDIGDDDDFRYLVRLSTRETYWKRIVVVGYGRFGEPSPEYIHEKAVQAVDPLPTPADGTIASLAVARESAPNTNTVTVTPGTLDATLTENFVVIRRNGIALRSVYVGTDTTPVVLTDSGLDTSNPYEYTAFVFNGGISGPMNRRIGDTTKTADSPRFVDFTPAAANVGGIANVQLSWVATTAGADGVRIEKSRDRVKIGTLGTGSLASGTVYDGDLKPAWYRPVAYLVATDAAIEAGAWSFWPGIGVPGSQGVVAPVFIQLPLVKLVGSFPFGLTPRVQLRWTCATSGAKQVVVQLSDDNGAVDAWSDAPGGVSTSVAAGTWTAPNDTYRTTDQWYRLVARDAAGTQLAASAGVHYVV